MADLKDTAKDSLQNQPANTPAVNGPQAKFKDYLTRYKSEIMSALPDHIKPDRMIRIALTSVSKTPKLQECEATTLFGCVVQAAQLGLEIDNGLGHAWMLPFWNSSKKRTEAQLIIGYMGMIELAYRSGQVKSIQADIVYLKDVFDYQYGTHPYLTHKPAYKEPDRGEYICAYAVAEMLNGGKVFVVLTKPEITKIMSRSLSKGTSGPWKSDFDQMVIKSAIRRIFKRLPKSPEIVTALHLESLREQQIPQEIDISNVRDGELELAQYPEEEQETKEQYGDA